MASCPQGAWSGFLGAMLVAMATSREAASDDFDARPLPIKTQVAFGEVEWTGWQPTSEEGLPTPFRPILLTHAGDKSGRIFVATQQGVIHIISKSENPQKSRVFLDIVKKVSYDDKTNEEGLLGLAFPPNHKENGEFFIYYTNRHSPHQNVVARYRVDANDPDRADPTSEEILLVFGKPFWNHDGGTICFGPDGYLYIAVGDGGAANDPFKNGQNLKSLLGKIHRIDVNRKEGGEPYAIPPDNPFVGTKGSRPEIWAYGLRNVWRMAFDPKTGQLWAGDVGQDLWEEIDIIVRGGNYGWNLREGMHPFGKQGAEARADLIEPVWEYHHDVGKSITGGLVYRGKQFPELEGAYLYADYVSNKIWALWYDAKAKRVVANRELENPGLPILSFGEDEDGEVYLTTFSGNGRGILRLAHWRDG